MSDDCYSQMNVDQLVEEFIREAQSLPASPAFPQTRSPERVALSRRLEAMSEKLLERAPVERLRLLFDHESNAVRAYAVAFFLGIDQELAFAAIAAMAAGLSTGEVMDYCARSRRGPPSGPPLHQMSIQQLAERYEDAGIRSHGAQFMGGPSEPWDVTLANTTIQEMIDVRNELESRNAERELLRFLDHENITVRAVAASQCLSIEPEKSIPVLEAVVKEGAALNRMSASSALYDWRQAHPRARET